MAFTRAVMIDGTLYRKHEAVRITHELDGGTTVRVMSRDSGDGSARYTQHAHKLDDTLGFAAAEEWLQGLPAFEPYEDPAQAALDEVLPILTDEQAETVPDAFPAWAAGIAYAVGYRVRYGGVLYKCVQAHTSQEDWTPDKTPALWVRIGEPGEIPVWVQPTGAQDAYNTGDKVHYPTIEDPVYESTIDGNVWSPADYPAGWTEVA